jgi:hypothetical protein
MKALFAVAYALCAVPLLTSASTKCANKFAECDEHFDDCERNPGFMAMNCPKSCHTCHLRDFKARCSPSFLNISIDPVLKTGDLHSLFLRLANNSEAGAVHILSNDPWIAEIDNFLPDNIVDDLLSQATQWDRSYESGAIDAASGEGTPKESCGDSRTEKQKKKTESRWPLSGS